MNTEQKAREWFNEIAKFIQPTITELDAAKIITALLAEREALMDAVRLMLLDPTGCPMCDSGILRGDNQHWNTCGFNLAKKAIAMCEESK